MKQLVIIQSDFTYNSLYTSLVMKLPSDAIFHSDGIITYLLNHRYNVKSGIYKHEVGNVIYSPTIDFEDDKEYLRFVLEFS